MSLIPIRLVGSTFIKDRINGEKCNNCMLLRRTHFNNLNELITPGGEFSTDIWQSHDIFGLSLNLYLCNAEEVGVESKKSDVNIVLTEDDQTRFHSDDQLNNYNLKQIEIVQHKTIILCMITKDLDGLSGTYPFKEGQRDETIYDYKVQIVYDPLVLNIFHTQLEVLSNENGNWEKIKRDTKKNYLRKLASEIRSFIIHKKLVDVII